ncbi:MAG: maltose alpha-D-glucosyltransferase [Burkholderiaceae bacterium]
MSDNKTANLDRLAKTRKAIVRPKPDAVDTTSHGDPLWYKDAVVYQLHVKSYMDANGDGIGDFAGLLTKLDYIASLGVNTIWLLPFYPSPRRDDGYDIAEYTGVHPDYGTMADAKRFIHEAHKRNLRVITELVINHTSDQHQWFQKARTAKAGSAARNYYVWSDSDQTYAGTRIIFCDTEKSNWTWDPVAGAYFWHRFFSHQPDLNFDNPQVMKAVINVMRWWLDLGIDGLRLDAVPYLIEREGTSNENLPETHDILKLIRKEVDRDYPGRLLLAEANMWPEDTQQYFGDGDECHMAFHFPLMPRMYMAIAQEDRFPITDILRQTPEIPANCQWAIFLRNHDELTLEMVTDKERDYLWNFYAADRRARINLGIRRRLAPLLERDRRRIELMNSLLLSMPGTPVIYYGDEIGMGDNVHLGDRDGVRTPMQWSPDRNGGFSRANPASLVLPPIMDALYGFDAVNVESQESDPHSLLNWMRRMLAIRSQHQAFGRGKLRILSPVNRKVLAYLREYEGPNGQLETILCVANVSRSAQAVELELSEFNGRVPVEMIGGSMFPAIGSLPYILTLPPYGFFWFALAAEAELPVWHVPAPEALPDYQTLVVRKDIDELLVGASRKALEENILPGYLQKRRWFGAKDGKAPHVKVALATELPRDGRPVMMVEIETKAGSAVERYQLPFSFYGENESMSALPQQLAMARVRRGRQVGYLTDAFALADFAHQVVKLLSQTARVPTTDGTLEFDSTPLLQELMPLLTSGDGGGVRWLSAEQSNSSLVIADTAVLKVVRRIASGINPEAEITRFLTERGFMNTSPLLGEVSRVGADGTPHLLIVLQRFVHNQGDAWQWTLNVLTRVFRQTTVALRALPVMETADSTEVPSDASRDHAEALEGAALAELEGGAAILGKRLGQLHAILGAPSDDPAFAPEHIDAARATRLGDKAVKQIEAALDVLEQRLGTTDAAATWTPSERDVAADLVKRRAILTREVLKLATRAVGSLAIRIHGDFHLGQVLVTQGDAVIIDFEGEPAKTLAERRAKMSPLRDVAGLLRSIDYAAAMGLKSGPTDVGEAGEAKKREIVGRYLPAAKRAFLAAYRQEAKRLDHRWAHDDGETALLTLFTIEKAAYELCYEAANRPTWIGVPLAGLAELAATLARRPGKTAGSATKDPD